MNEEVNFCNQCGSKINSDAKFCSNCGHDLKNSSTKITSDKTIKVEVTNATIEKGFKAIGKGVKATGKGLGMIPKIMKSFWKVLMGVVLGFIIVAAVIGGLILLAQLMINYL